MQWSDRNYLFKSNKYGWLLYAGLTNSFFSISDDLKNKIDLFKKNYDINIFDDYVQKKFIKCGVISEYSDDELLNLYMLNWVKKANQNNTLLLTIAPTMACNFLCEYCFEKKYRSSSVMSDNMIDKLFQLIEASGCKNVNISWFGGEPLIAMDVIKKINIMLKEKEIKISQSIVTNGYLFNEEAIKYFHSVNLESIQITLDGTKETHNKKRPHKTNADSYSVIMKNIDTLYNYCIHNDYKIHASIRVNIDESNEDEFPILKKYFTEKYGDFFEVYFGIIVDTNNCVDKSELVLLNEGQKKFVEKLSTKYGILENNFYLKNNSNCYCCAQVINSYVIEPNGNVYKCWEDIGNESEKIFNLLDRNKINRKKESDFIIKSQAVFDPKCRECILLFTCLGGCPKRALENKRNCPVIRDNIDSYLEKHYESKILKGGEK